MSSLEVTARVSSPTRRLVALDWMRGWVMVLMTIDHASAAFNAGRLASDSAASWKVGSALPFDQFLTRWVTHLCAPTFVFLAGAALALSIHRRLERGDSPRELDGFHLRRGLFIALLDPLWISWAFREWGQWLFQVMYAMGLSMMCMVALRRLGARTLGILGLGLLVGNEWLGAALAGGGAPPLLVALLVHGGVFEGGRVVIVYPLVPWLGVMCLGWAFGCRLRASQEGVTRLLLLAGVGALGLFLLVRGLNGYGNEGLLREGSTSLQWLHVSKYPLSLAYASLELGLMALLLAGFWWVARRWGEVEVFAPLRLFGQTALFYYVLHGHLLHGTARLLDVRKQLGLGTAYAATVGVLAVLSVACARYRRYKEAHPQVVWTRYV